MVFMIDASLVFTLKELLVVGRVENYFIRYDSLMQDWVGNSTGWCGGKS